MIDKPEDYEKLIPKYGENDDSIHRNFRPGDKTKLDGAESNTERSIPDKEAQRRAAFGSKFQGDIGEGVTLRVATDKLELTPDPRFDQAQHRFDSVYQDERGNLAIIESKFDDRGIKALRNDQMQPEWVQRNAKLMQNPESKMFTTGNAEIGRDIDRVGASEVRRIVVATDPETLIARAYEGQADGNWKQIGAWSTLDLEQPYLK